MSVKKLFIVESYYTKGDTFGFSEPQSHLSFYCVGYTDLYKTLRAITPQGYGVPKQRWFSNWFKGYSGPAEFLNLLGKKTNVVKIITEPREVIRELDFTSNFGFRHMLKIVKNDALNEQNPTNTNQNEK